MPDAVGPNGPVRLDAASYDYDDLRTKLDAALAGDDAGRPARVRSALNAARKAPVGSAPSTVTIDAAIQRVGNAYTFTARRTGNLFEETRTFTVSGDQTSNPALPADFGGAFPAGQFTFAAGSPTATFIITSPIAEAA